eukprot:Rhum_TRINITY_DN15089_c1_g1::Rhum_TRINITY_DN15089_c1_g1_i1::g.136587::m.136587
MRVLCSTAAVQWVSRCRPLWHPQPQRPPCCMRRQMRPAHAGHSAYTAEALSKLLTRRTGADEAYDRPVVGRREAKRVLGDALAAGQVAGGRASVIAVVGVGGSGKTFFLRAGILRRWYPRNSIMVSYGEDVPVLDDGKVSAHVAFARQLVQANRRRGREVVDYARIESLATVVRAFRIALGLDASEALIVCVDGLIHLRAHVGDDTDLGQLAGHRRCEEVRAAAMSYQDDCDRRGAPQIRFVWTSPTHHFETSLGETPVSGERRAFHRILLSDLSATDSWRVLGDELTELATRDSVLRWGFYLCAGHPRSLAGLSRYAALPDACTDTSVAGPKPPARVEQAILEACRLTDPTQLALVSRHFCAVVAAPSTMDDDARARDREVLLTAGALHRAPQGTLRLHPALVRRWAGARTTELQRLVHGYLAPERFADARSLKRQPHLFEQILNCACAELRITPTLRQYFAGAEFCGAAAAALRDRVVHPRASSVRAQGEKDVRRRLVAGVAVYAQAQEREMEVDALIPLRLGRPQRSEVPPTTHVFCGQSGVAVNAGNVGDLEAKVDAVVDGLGLKKGEAHGLYWTTNYAFEGKSFRVKQEKESKKQKKKRKKRERENKEVVVVAKKEASERTGVWFTRPALEQWLGRIGMPHCTLPGIAPVKGGGGSDAS